jgi:hypothetical protein
MRPRRVGVLSLLLLPLLLTPPVRSAATPASGINAAQLTLTHYSADCSIDGVYNPGDPITEPAGPEHVHLGRNLGTTPLILEVIYIKPAGKPLAEDAANPGCPFA